MASRLDRLFVLLESGSSAVTRRAAANQLGEVQRLHPHELHNLLKTVLKYLKSSSWDTRIAAGWAVEAILKKVPQWDPVGLCDEDININGTETCPELAGRLTCDNFNLLTILESSAHLMGSEGKEYESPSVNTDNLSENLEKQKEILNQKLNLGAAAQLGFDTNVLYTVDDLKIEVLPNSDLPHKPNIGEVVGLSCREVNRAKRKARQAMSKQRSKDKVGSFQQSDDDEEPEKKKIKVEGGLDEESAQVPVPDNTNSWPINVVEWPLEWFCQQLTDNLFSPQWEVRHGAGTALKHLIKCHGCSGGKSSKVHPSQMRSAHESWLVDIALRLVCVVTLDRFGDFVFDQVVAPVRETCAQVLGSVANLMDKTSVENILKVLLQLLDQKDWETRHGGLLGIKYIFAVRQDLLGDLLPLSFSKLHASLTDPVDDVGAVAGGALATAVDLMSSKYTKEAVDVLNTLCALVPELDDLTPASNTFVPLLAQLLLKPNVSSLIRTDNAVSELIIRVWSLLEHNSTSVREAALNTLASLINHESFALLLQPTLRHLFQRSLLEHHLPAHSIVETVWKKVLEGSKLKDILIAACPYITAWLCLTMQPVSLPFDHNALMHPKPLYKETSGSNKSNRQTQVPDLAPRSDLKQFIGGSETVPANVREEHAAHARFIAARMIGFISSFVVKPAPDIVYTAEMESPIDCYVKVLLTHLNNRSALQRFVVGLVICEWAKCERPDPPPPQLVSKLIDCLNETVYYDEIGLTYSRLLQDMKNYLALLKHYKVPVTDDMVPSNILTLDQMDNLCSTLISNLLAKCKLKPKLLDTLQERRKTLSNSVIATSNEQNTYHVMTQAVLAGALVALKGLPEKLNPVVKPLMESIKKEENEELQMLSATHLAELVRQCIDRTPCPNTKIITNLISFLKSDPDFTPKVAAVNKTDRSRGSNDFEKDNTHFTSIITLSKQLKTAERAVLRRNTSSGGRGPGRPPAVSVEIEELIKEDNTQKVNFIQRRGATIALEVITRSFGSDLPSTLPNLWHAIVGDLLERVPPLHQGVFSTICTREEAENLIGTLQVLEVTCASIEHSLLPQVFSCVRSLIQLLSHKYSGVRHMASRCLAALASVDPCPVMELVIDLVIPLLSATNDDTKRRGAIEAITVIIEKLQLAIVPYIFFLVVPLLGRMSDQDESIRVLATHTFADLIQAMPLDGGVPNPPKLSPHLVSLKEEQRQFLEQLFNPAFIPDYTLPIPIKAELRSYQQAGVNWLAFLNRYKLHGMLCDDMGLGKTLQSICILAGDHYYRQQTFKETKRVDCAPLPSLVVCPPTLTGHWVYEVEKFISRRYLSPLQYAGPPAERERLRSQVKRHNLIVASYDIVRKDIDFFSGIKWNYCILDEGHVIKNGKTKSSKAIKQLKANHRLILSGTPIQNNVLELWSLFDFLMPGFLGTEKQFTARYSRPILMSRDPKSSPKEQEAGVLAMEALHRQVLPFVLRRMKEDVLKDLPPKITQDYYCELSPLQKQLYEDFAKSKAHQALSDTADTNQTRNTSHIFQALRYLQSVCNHPKLALNPKHPQYEKIIKELKEQNSSLSDISHAAKFPALKQLLMDCGIGVPISEQTDELVVNQHRALIFCQLKAMLDILENDFFKVHMPGVSYLRLDGSVPANLRHSFITRFNNDPTIECLILTTQVGGLGLNLTGADTVIFVEHDWSPMKDLQAMDRAHRIGQKKVVNVYRLITRATLEEKIMGLQKFKLMTANTVISSENASLETMGTDKLLDLFSLEGSGNVIKASGSSGHPNQGNSGTGQLKSVLDNLPDLWEQADYDEEYDLTNFLQNLNN